MSDENDLRVEERLTRDRLRRLKRSWFFLSFFSVIPIVIGCTTNNPLIIVMMTLSGIVSLGICISMVYSIGVVEGKFRQLLIMKGDMDYLARMACAIIEHKRESNGEGKAEEEHIQDRQEQTGC